MRISLRYSKLFGIPRKIVKHFLSILYPLVIKIWPLPRVLSIEDTLSKIIDEKCSISRYGDGEFLYIIDKLSLPFQSQNEVLRKKLISTLKSGNDSLLIGLPIGYHTLENLTRSSYITWRSQIAWIYPRLKKYLDIDKTYYNSSMTRPYIEYENKSHSKEIFEILKRIWEGRSVVIIEGEKSRLGVGNDLFLKAGTVKRILGPMHHAFDKYDLLLSEASKQEKHTLFLIALGPTATVLAADLSSLGYQAVDIGNIDIEYEWFLRAADKRIKIKGKYTSEAINGRLVEDVDDKEYQNQIICHL